jgi:SAM-dependent methyltransferase
VPTIRQSDGTPLVRGARWTPLRIARRTATVFRRRGAQALFFKLLGETVYRRLVLVEDDLERLLPPLDEGSGFETGLLEEDAIVDYLALRSDQTAGEVLGRLRRGERCSITRHEGRIVSAHWCAVRRGWIEPLECEIALEPDELYSYESYTAPEYRGHRLPAARARRLRRRLRAEGIRRRLGVVEPDDPSALRHAAQAGFRPIGRIARLGLGRRGRFVVSGIRGEEGARLPRPVPRVDWNAAAASVLERGYAVDPALAAAKRRAYLELVSRWGGELAGGRVLKTDLFEEAVGGDAFLDDVGEASTLRVGLDRAARIAVEARRRRSAARSALLAADVRELPFADGSFSLVVSPSTLDHFGDEDDLGRSLGELRRVLRPGGVLVVTLDNRENLTDPCLRAAAALGLVPFPLGRSYSGRELERELEARGFLVTDATTILHAPRLAAWAAFRIVRATRSRALVTAIERLFLRLQRLEGGRFARRTGSFVAARAVRPPEPP